MGGRGSALWWRAILLAMGCATVGLAGCMAPGTPEERIGEAESALNDFGEDTDPPDPVDPGETADPEPQPWVPGTEATMRAGAPAIHNGDGVKDDDPEPQPWKPPSDDQTTTSSSSTKQH